jgi:nitrite reductase/ring-hydroxylating ferredoxin subunit
MATEYKLKGVTSLNLKNGDKQEVEVEGIEGGKVLLLKVQDKVHATSANCTLPSVPSLLLARTKLTSFF